MTGFFSLNRHSLKWRRTTLFSFAARIKPGRAALHGRGISQQSKRVFFPQEYRTKIQGVRLEAKFTRKGPLKGTSEENTGAGQCELNILCSITAVSYRLVCWGGFFDGRSIKCDVGRMQNRWVWEIKQSRVAGGREILTESNDGN